MLCKKGVLKNFTKFTGLRPATLLKKRLWYMCFPETFAKFSRTFFFIEHFWWLLIGLGSHEFGRRFRRTEAITITWLEKLKIGFE